MRILWELDRKLGFPVTLNRSFEIGYVMTEPIYDAPLSRSVVVTRRAKAAFEDASRLRDVRAVCELRGLTYDLYSIRLTENAYGKFYRLREIGTHVAIKRGRSGLRRNEREKSVGSRQTAKPLKGGCRRRMVQHSDK